MMRCDSDLFFFIRDDFGQALAPFLLRYVTELKILTASDTSAADILSQVTPTATILAAFASASVPLCITYATAVDRLGAKLLPITLYESRIMIGPYGRSSTAACWVCATRRLRQNYSPAANDIQTQALRWEQPANLDLLAAATLSFLQRQTNSSAGDGVSWVLDGTSKKLSSGLPVPVNGCPLCFGGLGTSAEELQREIIHLSHRSIEG